jgi:hypothetical protein
MSDKDVEALLRETGAYLKAHSEEAIRELGVIVSPGLVGVPSRLVLVAELKGLLGRYQNGVASGAELRRIAELLEFLHEGRGAQAWWQRAARAGDALAIMMLDEDPKGEK